MIIHAKKALLESNEKCPTGSSTESHKKNDTAHLTKTSENKGRMGNLHTPQPLGAKRDPHNFFGETKLPTILHTATMPEKDERHTTSDSGSHPGRRCCVDGCEHFFDWDCSSAQADTTPKGKKSATPEDPVIDAQ